MIALSLLGCGGTLLTRRTHGLMRKMSGSKARAQARCPRALHSKLPSYLLIQSLRLPIVTAIAQLLNRAAFAPTSSPSLNTKLASCGQPLRCPPVRLCSFLLPPNRPDLTGHHSPTTMPITVLCQDLPTPSSLPSRSAPLYLIFHSSPWDPVAQSWCPDCRHARAALLDVFEGDISEEAWVLLTDREPWKRKAEGEAQHPWREQSGAGGWGVKCLPTLLRVDGVSICA